jgi:peptidyl-prolyl cis-trans isomerase SurA
MPSLMKSLALVLALVSAGPALAQGANPFAPAFYVNQGVITRYDIDQRIKLLDALGAGGDLRELAVEQLTDDRLKTQAAEALEIELPEGAIDAGFAEFATNRGLAIEDVERVLVARGIDRQTMNDFVEAGLLWREVVITRFRARAMPTEADLDAALEMRATSPQEMLTLAEIALPFAERGEAETVALADDLYRRLAGGADFAALAREYSRSGTAAQGGRLEPVPATNLPPAFRSQVLLLGTG